MELLKNIVFGVILGISNVIPGVSGGTMAVILNVYDKLLYAISLKNIKKNARFLAAIGGGCLIGIVAFSKIVLYLLNHYEMAVNFCFIGLILGSVPMIYKRARYEKLKLRNFGVFLLALAGMLFLTWVAQGEFNNQTLEQAGGLTVFLWFRLLVTSFISVIAMLLPGISGSFVMLLLGSYTICMEAIASFDLLPMIPIGLGVLSGAFVGIKFIKKLLRFHPQALYCAILGLILGSIFTIYPGFTADAAGFLSLVLMAGFAGIAYFFSRKT